MVRPILCSKGTEVEEAGGGEAYNLRPYTVEVRIDGTVPIVCIVP